MRRSVFLSILRRGPASAALFFLAPAVWAQDTAVDAPGFEARALVTTGDWAVLSSQILAPIAAMPKQPGASFRAGDVLVTLNCDDYAAERAAGQAEVRQAKAQLQAQERLFELQSAGNLDVEIARAALDRAEANLKLQDVRLDRCTVTAPYDGAVVRWAAQPHQTVSVGNELIEIVGTGGLELELIVPSSWLAWLRKGNHVVARIDENGSEVVAEVSRLSARIDPVSQTIKIYAKITAGRDKLLAGMSGRAVISPAQ
ncbi:MAG: efflux RND transporter periplasmic adaptor subunit [Alphaproteobacteria bacterium]|nr:MAG: efflux RND transporter periplasmic adaptor subunit [Alphaproteobacteria bacterium]